MKKQKKDKTVIFSILGIIAIVIFIAFIDKVIPSPVIDESKIKRNLESAPNYHEVYPNATGNVTVLEFSDFQCPFCKQSYPIIEKLRQRYGDEIMIKYKHFPLPMHEYAMDSAIASECARLQGKFWEYHNVLFENQNSLSTASLKKYAQKLNLDTEKFDSCLDNKETIAKVQKDFNEGNKLGVSGTPTFFINDKKIEGGMPYDQFVIAIDGVLGR